MYSIQWPLMFYWPTVTKCLPVGTEEATISIMLLILLTLSIQYSILQWQLNLKCTKTSSCIYPNDQNLTAVSTFCFSHSRGGTSISHSLGMALTIWTSIRMRRSPKSPKEPFSWTPVWVWFRYIVFPVFSMAVMIKLTLPITGFAKWDIPFGAADAQDMGWSLGEIKTPFTKNKQIWKLPLFQ